MKQAENAAIEAHQQADKRVEPELAGCAAARRCYLLLLCNRCACCVHGGRWARSALAVMLRVSAIALSCSCLSVQQTCSPLHSRLNLARATCRWLSSERKGPRQRARTR